MKYIFIINPKSGKKDSTGYIKDYLEKKYSDLKYEIYNTKAVGDAIKYVKNVCEAKEEPITFIACGGDGTLNEVVNGAYGYNDVYVSVYPCGSGNDFVKVFGKTNHFLDLNKIINGENKVIDVLKVNDRYTINMCNLGFDASVAYKMHMFRKWPLVSGKGAYNLALAFSLIFKMKHKCTIEIDGEEVFDGKMLLTAIGNGLCCGGGYYCLPKAIIDDGEMDVVFIKKISRITFIRLVKKYKNGTYLEDPRYDKFITYKKCKNLTLKSQKDIAYSLDGECETTKEINVSIVEKAINFIVPKEYN